MYLKGCEKAEAWKSLIALGADFFTDTEVENVNSSPPHPARWWDLRNSCSTFYTGPVQFMLVPNWTQGGTEVPHILPWDLSSLANSHPRRRPGNSGLQEHSSQAGLAETSPWWLESWNVAHRLCFPKRPSWCQFESAPPRWWKHRIKLLPFFPPLTNSTPVGCFCF